MKRVTNCRLSNKQVLCVCCAVCVVRCVMSRDVANEFEVLMKRVPKCRQSDEQVLCVCVVLCGARCVMCAV